MQTLLTASVLIQSPLLEVFDYVTDPDSLPEWIPVYSDISNVQRKSSEVLTKGDTFEATLGFFTNVAGNTFAPFMMPNGSAFPSLITGPKVSVRVDDLVHGRRIAYRANVGWTTLCDFEAAGGATLFTMTQSLWSLQGLFASFFTGPMQAFYNEIYREILAGLKRRLEGRAVEGKPQVFFSYSRAGARHVGGRIYDALTAEFGKGTVFRDSESLLAGGDWLDAIRHALALCKVVVVHIGDNWEERLKDPEHGGLRDELVAALMLEPRPQIVPVMTTEREGITLLTRMTEIETGLAALEGEASVIRATFHRRLQIQLLREDPDFSRDLEGMMRAVWAAFRPSKG